MGHVDVEQGVQSLYPTQPGRVAEVLVHEDQSVPAGAILFRLDERPAKFLVQQAQADLKAANAQLADARKLPEQHRSKIAQQRQAIAATQHRLSAARHVLVRKQNLVKSQQAPAEEAAAAGDLVKELEAAESGENEKLRELELFDPAPQIARAEADVAAKESRLEQAQYALAECSVHAPGAGKVLRLLISQGDILSAQPKQPAVLFCPTGPRIVRAEVEQEFAGRIALGQIASIQDDSKASVKWQGKVIRISDWYTHRRSILQEPLQFNDVRTLECIIELDPHQDAPRIGQRVRVTLGKP
jgi:multidrug resistance efflux pump